MSSKGFTLVEVLVATVLLAVGVAGVQVAIAACTGALGRADEYQVAGQLVREKMTELWTGQLPLQSDEGDFPEGPEGYLWRLEVSEAEREGMWEVLLVVQAPSGREYPACTLLLNREEQAAGSGTSSGPVLAPSRAGDSPRRARP